MDLVTILPTHLIPYIYIEIQGTTLSFCPKNLGILVSGMDQLQGVFEKGKKLQLEKIIFRKDIKITFWTLHSIFTQNS